MPKLPNAEKVAWIREELGGGADLPEFSRKFLEMFSEKLRGPVPQKAACLKLYSMYSSEGPWQKETSRPRNRWPSSACGTRRRLTSAPSAGRRSPLPPSTAARPVNERAVRPAVGAVASWTPSTPIAAPVTAARPPCATTETSRLKRTRCRSRSAYGLAARSRRTPGTSPPGRGGAAAESG